MDVRHFIVFVDEPSGAKVAAMSRGTKTLIVGTPTVLFYIDGVARAKFNPPYEASQFFKFLEDMIQLILSVRQQQQPRQFVSAPTQPIFQNKNVGYANLGTEEDDEAVRLHVPDNVTPWNTPWEGAYKKLEP